MTTLANYLTQNGLTVAAFARRAGLPRMQVHRHAKLGVIPRPATMEVYRQATDGHVTPGDFYAAQEPPQPPRKRGRPSTAPHHPAP